MKVSTVRLPDDVDRALTAHCERTGATRNRATVLALRAWLGDGPPPAAHVQPPADAEAELVRLLEETLDAREVDPGT